MCTYFIPVANMEIQSLLEADTLDRTVATLCLATTKREQQMILRLLDISYRRSTSVVSLRGHLAPPIIVTRLISQLHLSRTRRLSRHQVPLPNKLTHQNRFRK